MATPAPGPVEQAASCRGPAVAAGAVLLLFFGGFGGWASFVPLSGAAVAPAVVASEGYRKTIQHLEGGIVAQIRVREGAVVQAGSVLVVLDDTRARAEFAAAAARLAGVQARAARLDAQQTGADATVFPAELLAQAAEDAATADLLRAEDAALAAQRHALADQIAVRDQRIEQARSDLAAYEGGLASIDSQAALLDEQIATVEDLLNKGLERRPRLLDLLRARAALDGQRIAIVGDAARTRELINTTAAERAALRSGQANDVALQLADARGSISQLQAAVDAARDQLNRTLIRAPIAGEVVDLRIHTPGGVIQPGAPLMDLVPRDEPLVLEARVSPKDIDVVHPGLWADVHLLAYRTRNLPRLRGEVRQVSGDRLVDAKSGEPYYSARIVVDMETVRGRTPEVRLTAGMPAEALILTGERTLLGYLTDPIRQNFRRALREN